MNEGNRTVVWILGAGFSQPLGGPMLGQLLSPASYSDLEVRYGSRFVGGPDNRWVWRIYEFGRAYADGAIFPEYRGDLVGQRLWGDAEVFMAKLDGACAENATTVATRFDRLQSLLNGRAQLDTPISVHRLRDAARAVVAAECCAFLAESDVQHAEGWVPYLSWASRLQRGDAVLTFNFDTIPERLHIGPRPRDFLDVAFSFKIPSKTQSAFVMPPQPIVAKLHGSVSWKRVELGDGTVRYEHTNELEFAATCPAAEVGIATPGPTKAIRAGELSEYWDFAEWSIRTADAIVFVGYRFPPTDAQSRTRLLGAIRKNESDDLRVHTVLGPNTGHDDAVRLDALLRYTIAQRTRTTSTNGRLLPHRMYSQDFLEIADRRLLLG